MRSVSRLASEPEKDKEDPWEGSITASIPNAPGGEERALSFPHRTLNYFPNCRRAERLGKGRQHGTCLGDPRSAATGCHRS